MNFASIYELVEYQGRENEDRLFISSPEDDTNLTFGQFHRLVRELAGELAANGLRRGERVAIQLVNGLNYAISFIGIIVAGGVVVPINPQLKPAEVNYLLTDSQSRFVLTNREGMETLSLELAELAALGLQIGYGSRAELMLIKLPDAAPGGLEQRTTEGFSLDRDDDALLLYTSGTIGRPKGVILTHGNLLAEAGYIQEGHRLTRDDVALCILPLFHINGLVITLITPLFSGGRVIMPEKFRASRFWQWVSHYQVTWFSAVPTILSIMLNREPPVGLNLSSLRFARSASSSLPVALLEEFEKRFNVPVIEAYGLSEAGSQVATNPLPPEVRKPGSVGLPVGNQLIIVDEDGNPLPAGVSGEVIVRGRNVSRGYINNPEANAESFKKGWFYTGDLGFYDEDGYLFLTGRRKELINRAGEKISPREVDEVLYQLPAIEIAAAVGVPDSLYGEEVVAFIKVRPGADLGVEEIFNHCKKYLADFKVPKQVYFTEDFPKGPSGKVQRQKLSNIYQEQIQERKC